MCCGLNLYLAITAERKSESESGLPCMSSDVMCDFILQYDKENWVTAYISLV